LIDIFVCTLLGPFHTDANYSHELVCIAKFRKSGKVHCSGQRIVLISDTTSDLP